MKLIVGLGNPGIAYAGSRHNVGFHIVRQLAKRYKIAIKKDKKSCSLSGCGKIEGEKTVLALPLTFMNLSGSSVKALLKNHRIALQEMLVICDDLDLSLGRIKIRGSGSSGGHRGLGSLIDVLGRDDFCRLRVGIGRPQRFIDPANYVLSGFNKSEEKQLKPVIDQALECVSSWISKGLNYCTNMFNKRTPGLFYRQAGIKQGEKNE